MLVPSKEGARANLEVEINTKIPVYIRTEKRDIRAFVLSSRVRTHIKM